MTVVKRTYGRDRDHAVVASDGGSKEILTTSKTTLEQRNSAIQTPNAGHVEALVMSQQFPHETDEENEAETSEANHGPFTFEENDIEPAKAIPIPRLTVAQIMEDTDSDIDEEESAYDRMRRTLLQAKVKDTTPATESHSNQAVHSPSIEASEASVEAVASPPRVHNKRTDKGLRLAQLAKRRAQAQEAAEVTEPVTPPHQDQHADTTSDSEDIEAEIRLSSSRRAPRRAATKKALEEMHKETERIQRSMTLAPEAQVKVRLRISDFLSKVGYSSTTTKHETVMSEQMTSEAVEDAPDVLPPTAENGLSPIEPQTESESTALRPYSEAFATNLEESDDDIELPAIDVLMSSQPAVIPPAPVSHKAAPTSGSSMQEDVLLDSDSDSSSEPTLPRHLKSHALLFKKRDFEQIKRDRRAAKFVAMARPDSPTKTEARLERARRAGLIVQVARQAKVDRQAREAAMKDAGIAVMSVEQRQKEALEIEDLVEKARRQAAELRKLEQLEDKKARAEADGVNDDEESDRDWDGDDESVGEDSPSETESEEESATSDAEDMSEKQLPSSVHGHEYRTSPDLEATDDEDMMISKVRRRGTKKSRVLDDEADSDANKENAVPEQAASQDADFGLTQFFLNTPQQEVDRRSLAEISFTQFVESPIAIANAGRVFAGSDLPISRDTTYTGDSRGQCLEGSLNLKDDKLDYIPSSQPDYDIEKDGFQPTQFSVFGPPSPDEPIVPLPLNTQFTQATVADQGIEAHDTQVDPATWQPSGSPKKTGLSRLRQSKSTSDESSFSLDNMSATPPPPNVFKRMRKAMNEQEQRRSRRALVDDRAVESDDEYAGLGGLSDEDPEDAEAVAAELADMIDHDVVDDDEEGQRRIAAFYAQKDLENDEKLVQNLMNDINNGGLRRKRGAGLLDMDDSEDEEEEAARYKARQAQMRARLLESQNLTSLAENPKTKAFIEALEDRPVESTTFIEIAGEEDIVPETQYEKDSQAPAALVRSDTQVDELQANCVQSQMAPPAQISKKLARKRTDADIRNELSFLRDDEGSTRNSEQFDPTFVPSLKRERSSLTIEDRAHLSRESSMTWKDPRSNSQTEESMYSQLAANRRPDSRDSSNRPVVVVSKGTHMASRMATKAVNYHARAARTLKEGKNIKETSKERVKKARRESGAEGLGQAKRKDVLKLFA